MATRPPIQYRKETLERAVEFSLFLRRATRHVHGLVIAAAFGALVAALGRSPTTTELALFVAASGAFLVTRFRMLKRGRRVAPALVITEIGWTLFAVTAALLGRFDGGIDGAYSPAFYMLIALLVSFAKGAEGVLLVAGLLGFEALLRFPGVGLVESAVRPFAAHAAFSTSFAVLNYVFLRAEVSRLRGHARSKVEVELKKIKDDARSYRLLSASAEPSGSRERSEERLTHSSVEEIHESVHYALDLLRRTLDLHTAVLFWLNDAGTHLRISELSSASDEISDAPIAAGDGVLGAVFQHKESVLLSNLTPSYKVPYYAGPNPTRVLLAIPVLEDGRVRGILAIDRTELAPFTTTEEELATQAARYCQRAIQNERVFVQLERAKAEQGKLYRAAQALGAALSEHDVLEAGVRAAREIASFDLAAVTIYDDASKMHEVCAAKSAGNEIDDLVGARFQPNTGLVSMVVKNKFPLPYRGEYDPQHQIVLTKRFPWPEMPSLLVLPLLLHDKPLGTLILGAKRKHAFGDSVRPTLEVLASHLAVSLSNARMVQKLETMATTDGLTGLLNKRAMLEAATQKVTAAARFKRKLAVLVTDIDHFKKVNDTHGHDVGDVVIKGLAEILKRHRRATDLVARFGGEEFVIVCEETDEAGGLNLAERVREELAKTVFPTKSGPLSVTCSIGVSTFDKAGTTWEQLFKAADEALYLSKRGGRNRTTVWESMRVRIGHSGPAPAGPGVAPTSAMQVKAAKPKVA